MVKYIIIALLIIILLPLACKVSFPLQQNTLVKTTQPPDKHNEHQIVYISKGQFWIMDETGQNRQVIWNCPALFECETMSPDWRRGIYLEKGDKVWNVRLREIEKEEGRILMADVPHKDFFSVWAPDGKKLAVLFYSTTEGKEKDNELYLVDVETGDIKLLDTGISVSTWSPDSKQLVYRDFRSQSAGQYIMDLKTGIRTKIVTTTLAEGREVWSPDSQKLAFTITSVEGKLNTSVFISDMKDGTLIRIPDPKQYNYGSVRIPSWSPDGSQIAYIAEYSDTGGKSHFRTLFIHNMQSGKQTPLVDKVQVDRVIWSPDSQKIIYQSHEDRNYYIIDIKTKQTTKILDGEVGDVIAWE